MNDTIKKTIIGAIVGGLVVLGFIFFARVQPTPIIVNVPKQEQQPNFGSITNPDVTSPYFSINGVQRWPNRGKSSASGASSTLCQFKSPPSASSTLVSGSVTALSTTTAYKVYVIKNSSILASSTNLGGFATGTTITGIDVAANVPLAWGFTATTSVNNLAASTSFIFGPNDLVTFRVVGLFTKGEESSGLLGGACSATFEAY